jgi:uncharacterized alkaline shock family protein YloU
VSQDGYRRLEASGSVEVTASAIQQIVTHAVARAGGARLLRPRRSAMVTLNGSRARVALALAAGREEPLAAVGGRVQHEVASALETMCGLEVDAVDVVFEEIEP